jgi:hypothetical protein
MQVGAGHFRRRFERVEKMAQNTEERPKKQEWAKG